MPVGKKFFDKTDLYINLVLIFFQVTRGGVMISDYWHSWVVYWTANWYTWSMILILSVECMSLDCLFYFTFWFSPEHFCLTAEINRIQNILLKRSEFLPVGSILVGRSVLKACIKVYILRKNRPNHDPNKLKGGIKCFTSVGQF